MSGNSLGANGAKALAAALRSSSPLWHLGLREANIDVEGLKALITSAVTP